MAFPARYDKVIAVSASDHSDADSKASFSNWGPEVAVTAPGVDIVSTVPAKFCGAQWTCIGERALRDRQRHVVLDAAGVGRGGAALIVRAGDCRRTR